MKIIENSKVKEKVYIEKLENGLTVMIIPKKGIQKKYVIWGTNYGSNDSKFVVPGEENETEVPKGVAHFLEHKMFEQENGVNSLDALTALGVDANAYTTNDHTAYLFECTENFYPALDELMDYVQHPYFTDENVEKEKGIIGQEIMMYDDYPEWKVYLNAMEAMYHEHPVKLDIAGTIETISHIDKDILYKCYNTFYNPSNMAMVICGDFEPEELLEEIKKRLIDKKANGEIKRIYPEEPEEIVKEKIEQINSEEFNRIKKRIYGEYVKEYNDVADIARMFLADFFKEINSFDYLDEINTVNEQYAEQILKEIFDDKKMIISVIKKV